MSEQRFGILGSMGLQVIQGFCQQILGHIGTSCDQEHLPTLIQSDTSTLDRTATILDGDAEGCYCHLLGGARLLERGGYTAPAIPCSISYCLVDRLQGNIAIPLIHISRETAGMLAADGEKRVGILTTDGTAQTGIYQRECATRGMEGVTPLADVQKLVMSIIHGEIKRDEKSSREKFTAIGRWLCASDCGAATLDCIELSVYHTHRGLFDYHLDVMEILVEECVTTYDYRLQMVQWEKGGQRGAPSLPFYPKRPIPTSAHAFGLPRSD